MKSINPDFTNVRADPDTNSDPDPEFFTFILEISNNGTPEWFGLSGSHGPKRRI